MSSEERYYEFEGGKRYVSVTTALQIIRKPWLERWRGRLGNDVADATARKAADLGLSVHACIEAIHGDKEWPAMTVEQSQMVAAFREWHDSCVDEVLGTERVLRNDQYQYAGTTDLIVRLRGSELPSIIDVKTTAAFSPDMRLQTAAYQAAHHSMKLGHLSQRGILRLGKGERAGKWDFRPYPVEDYQRDFIHFLYALALWRFMKGAD